MAGNVQIAASLNPTPRAASVMEMPMVEIEQVNLWYGSKQALKNVSMSDPQAPDHGATSGRRAAARARCCAA